MSSTTAPAVSLDVGPFTDIMADLLRLPDETVAMTYIYVHKYERFIKSAGSHDMLDQYTLALASLSLAAKCTESPRRFRELILPAHHLLHGPSLTKNTKRKKAPETYNRLLIPSTTYDTLRATLVQAELILIRVLGFELRFPLPLEHLPRYLERALGSCAKDGDDYDDWNQEQRDEYGVVGYMETRVARTSRAKAVAACKNDQLANLFPARAVAAGCLFQVLKEKGMLIVEDPTAWLNHVTNGKVDIEDFREALEILSALPV